MQQKGFTLIEMMVAATIIGLLASMFGQNYHRAQSVQRFDTEVQNVFFTILDARTNAIAEKKCANDETGKAWDVKINQSGFSISCDDVIQKSIPLSLIVLDSIKFPPETSDQINVRLKFLPELAQLRIENENASVWTSKRKAQITLHHNSIASEKRTICIDRIAGFPTLITGEDCSE